MRKKITFGDLASILENYDIVELEDVKIEGDMEVELSQSGAIPPPLIQVLQSMLNEVDKQVEATLSTRKSLIQMLQPVQYVEEKKVAVLESAKFEVAKAAWTGKIEEVTIGATSADGGTRESTVTIGGEKSLPFYNSISKCPIRQ